jgi:exodeoxyribonuclease VII small subunit
MAPSRKPNLPREAGPDEPAAARDSAAVTPATAGADTTTISATDISPAGTTTAAPTSGGSTPAGTAPAATRSAAASPTATAPTAITSTGTAAAAELPAAKVGRRRSKDQSESSQLKSEQVKAKTESQTKQPTSDPQVEQSIAADLSYGEARMALELTLAQLQASDLDVESMTGLFSRARSYAARCETLLMQVEQEVALWDSDNPEQAPQPYRPA